MNKAITDGLVLMPAPFAAGLNQWSKGDGTAGSATYQGAPEAALVATDQDFGGCLELQKLQPTTKLRYMAQTPILPGCYLRITARVKAVSGNLPQVRIAAWAGGAGDQHVTGLVETGSSVSLTTYGEVVTAEAIIGSGWKAGVDMRWGTQALYAHVGLDLTGPNGGVVRIDDLVVEDVTSAFLRDMMDWVDVRDYGARGDGTTNDAPAFAAADAAAAASGRQLFVSRGSYFLDDDLTLEAPARFEGTVTMPAHRRLSMTRSFDLPSYAAAFASEELGFRKAFQALLNFADHEALDLGGRRIEVTAPIDMQAAVANKTVFSTRRVIRNGQFNAVAGPAWMPTVVTSQASYSPTNPKALTGVANAANVPVGSLVSGAGVGREVYVTAVNLGTGTITLSQPLHGGAGTQVFTFTRFKYLLDFAGFVQLDKMNFDDVEFQCNGIASGILLAPAGEVFQLRDCYITRPRHRGLTSIGTGCQGMLVDRCHFLSDEMSARWQDRISIGMNVNANDVKLRDNRVARFRHFAVLGGANHLLTGNHIYNGDDETQGLRGAGVVLATTNVLTTVTGNYIDNAALEWTNEYEADPVFSTRYSFGGLTVQGNTFLCGNVAPWFAWLVVKPYGAGHFIHGLNVSGNVFKAIAGTVDRIDKVDTTFALLDPARMRNITFEGNIFNAVTQICANPVTLDHDQATAQAVWTVGTAEYLPFGGWARNVEAVTARSPITGPAGERRSDMPWVATQQGANKTDVALNWLAASKGKVTLRVRMDNPN